MGIRGLKKLNIAMLAVFLTLFSSNLFAKNSIIKSKTGEHDGKIRLVFELSNSPKYRTFTTSKPLQLVIDIQNCLADKKKISLGHDLFKNYSVGKNPAGDLRIKIDLSNKVKIDRSFILKPSGQIKNYRLVVDLEKPRASSLNKSNKSATPLNSQIADKIISKTDPETGTVKYIVKTKTKPKPKRIPVIVIDAGHGGKDPGTIGKYARTKEKNVTLAYARELKKHLDQTKKFKTYLTRRGDYFIPLNERVAISRKLKADLFISVHADSAENSSTNGLSIYTLSEKSSDKQAEMLASKENRSDIIGGADLSTTKDDDILKTLINLSQRSSMNSSAKFAEMSIKYFDKNNVSVLQNTHRFAGFRVLTAPDIPAVLIELGYLSNKHEERLLNSFNHRKRVAESLVKSIEAYFNDIGD